ncbi:MAG: GspH/FimT family pseudopilin [Candidatus Accumulibacter sp.]|jgi:type IV fimbrial biogenesis protein FimT|nr:GspH/FimT family pseudopilin [Accumulibacter sp.]
MLIPRTPRRSRGVTLIEVLIGLVIMGILIAMAVPNFTGWIRNQRVRAAAESLLNGLQTARAEALKTNAVVNFRIETDRWKVVGRDNAEIQSGQWSQVVVAADRSSFCFNGMGRLVSPAGCGAGPGSISISGTDGAGNCAAAGGRGETRCLRIEVNAGSGARLCDPALPGSDTQGCK